MCPADKKVNLQYMTLLLLVLVRVTLCLIRDNFGPNTQCVMNMDVTDTTLGQNTVNICQNAALVVLISHEKALEIYTSLGSRKRKRE